MNEPCRICGIKRDAHYNIKTDHRYRAPRPVSDERVEVRSSDTYEVNR